MSGLQPVEGFPELRLRLPRHIRLRFLIQVRWGLAIGISKGAKIDCLSIVMCPLLAQLIIGFFFLLQLFTVLMKKTHAVKQSIFLDVFGLDTP
jgi:hypothetical protein